MNKVGLFLCVNLSLFYLWISEFPVRITLRANSDRTRGHLSYPRMGTTSPGGQPGMGRFTIQMWFIVKWIIPTCRASPIKTPTIKHFHNDTDAPTTFPEIVTFATLFSTTKSKISFSQKDPWVSYGRRVCLRRLSWRGKRRRRRHRQRRRLHRRGKIATLQGMLDDGSD